MTEDERLDRIDELKASNDQLRAEREERERAREANPFAYDDWLRAERSVEPEPIIYRRYDGNASAAFPEPEPSGDDEELANAVDKFADAIERRLFELDKENAELRAKVGKLEGKLDAVLALMKPKVWKP